MTNKNDRHSLRKTKNDTIDTSDSDSSTLHSLRTKLSKTKTNLNQELKANDKTELSSLKKELNQTKKRLSHHPHSRSLPPPSSSIILSLHEQLFDAKEAIRKMGLELAKSREEHQLALDRLVKNFENQSMDVERGLHGFNVFLNERGFFDDVLDLRDFIPIYPRSGIDLWERDSDWDSDIEEEEENTKWFQQPHQLHLNSPKNKQPNEHIFSLGSDNIIQMDSLLKDNNHPNYESLASDLIYENSNLIESPDSLIPLDNNSLTSSSTQSSEISSSLSSLLNEEHVYQNLPSNSITDKFNKIVKIKAKRRNNLEKINATQTFTKQLLPSSTKLPTNLKQQRQYSPPPTSPTTTINKVSSPSIKQHLQVSSVGSVNSRKKSIVKVHSSMMYPTIGSSVVSTTKGPSVSRSSGNYSSRWFVKDDEIELMDDEDIEKIIFKKSVIVQKVVVDDDDDIESFIYKKPVVVRKSNPGFGVKRRGVGIDGVFGLQRKLSSEGVGDVSTFLNKEN